MDDPQQSMPPVSLPTVYVDDDPNQLLTEYNSKTPQPAAENGVVYANQPLSVSNGAQQPAMPSVTAPNIADDVDLIEKEWVSKISETIQKTKGDPYERARQLALLKSEYLQKRYQKTIKLT